MTYGKITTIPAKKLRKLPFLERKFFQIVPATSDVTETFRQIYGIEKKARQKGTVVRFGEGENRLGVITKVVPKGVYVQELNESKKGRFGLQPMGKPFFVKQERFEKHLGEKSAIGVDLMVF